MFYVLEITIDWCRTVYSAYPITHNHMDTQKNRFVFPKPLSKSHRPFPDCPAWHRAQISVSGLHPPGVCPHILHPNQAENPALFSPASTSLLSSITVLRQERALQPPESLFYPFCLFFFFFFPCKKWTFRYQLSHSTFTEKSTSFKSCIL